MEWKQVRKKIRAAYLVIDFITCNVYVVFQIHTGELAAVSSRWRQGKHT